MDIVPCEIFNSVLPRSCPLRHCMQRVLPPSPSLKAPRGAWRNRNELPLLQAATASLRHRTLFSSLIGGRKTNHPAFTAGFCVARTVQSWLRPFRGVEHSARVRPSESYPTGDTCRALAAASDPRTAHRARRLPGSVPRGDTVGG